MCTYIYTQLQNGTYKHMNIPHMGKHAISKHWETRLYIYLHNWKITIIKQIVVRKIKSTFRKYRWKLLITAIAKTLKPVSMRFCKTLLKASHHCEYCNTLLGPII